MPRRVWVTEFFLATFFVFFFAACVSKGRIVDAEKSPKPGETSGTVAATATANNDTVINNVLNTSAYDGNVYIGISGRMSFREKEQDYAKVHIANQIAMNKKCVVDYGYVSIEGSLQNDHAMYDSNFDYDDTAVDEILEHLVIVDEHRFPGFTVLAARDSREPPDRPAYQIERNINERPSWVRRMPEIDGYYTATGIGERYSEPYKSILVADVEAAQNLAKEKNVFVRGFTYNAEQSRAGASKLVAGDIFLTRAELYGFYILDRWIENDGTCYSLAIAKKQ